MSLNFNFPVPLDKSSLVLNEDEKAELAKLNREIARLQTERISKLREFARQKGITAARLEDLKSECGQPFIEDESGFSYRRATAKGEGKSHRELEIAYLCASPYLMKGEDEYTCGWVKGNVIRKKYDEIGLMSGSAGTRYFCKICGKQVAEFQEVVS